jgi:hypothetical protein
LFGFQDSQAYFANNSQQHGNAAVAIQQENTPLGIEYVHARSLYLNYQGRCMRTLPGSE